MGSVDVIDRPRDGAGMLTKAHIDRLDLSERVIDGWEAMGGPGGTPAELLRMVTAEVAILETLRAEDPERVSQIIERYENLAQQLRRQFA